MKKLFILVMGIAFTVACKKKAETVVALDYAPNTAGTNWTYVQTQNSVNTTYKLTVTNRDSTIGTRSYRVVSNNIGSNAYTAKTGSDYYRAGFLNLANAGMFEELYLKDGVSVSSNWTQQIPFVFSGFPLVVNVSFTVQEVGSTKVVLGTTFKDVVRVRMDASIPSASTNLGGGDFYYAKGIGLINYVLSTNAVPLAGIPAINATVNLQAYEIK